MDAPRTLEDVKTRLAQIVAVVAKVLRPAVVGGLIATAVIAIALSPWLFHNAVAAVVWAALVVIGLVSALRLLWHSKLLQRTLGNPVFIDQSLAAAQAKGQEHYDRLSTELDGVLNGDKGTKARSALKMLTNVRNLSAFKEVSEASTAVIEPISPQRMALTAYAAAIVALTIILSVPIVFFSVIGLLLR
jgi:hypothetical protein